ncbi:MAG: AI-2E family transporter [Treponema sp.]|jgi:predicted PurR-regulated permease PerM|nr:AI-2E family transporter [Treponema sp.]
MENGHSSRLIPVLLILVGIIAAAAALKAASTVVLPLAFAVLASFALEPVIEFMHRRLKFPWTLAILVVIVICFVVITFLVSLLASSLRTIFAVYPRYEARFTIIYSAIAGVFKLPFDADISLFGNLWSHISVRSFVQTAAFSLSNWLVDFSKNLLLVMLLIIFFLIEFRSFRKKIIFAVSRPKRKQVMGIINDVTRQVTEYLSIKFFISLATGVLVFLGCLIAGLDFAILWGFLAFIANFIPNFGSIVSGILTTLFSLLQFWPHPGPVAAVGAVMLGVNMILGNVVEPRIQGNNLGLSPFFILASLSVWGWIWGFAGMILAVPMMVILKIVCENVSFLRPLSILMGSASSARRDGRKKETKNERPSA